MAGAPARRAVPPRPRRGRAAAAGAALLALYVLLSLFNDPRGYLGTDTGGKVATLLAMERAGALDPDIGYWAEPWDPAGRLHPLYFTYRIGDGWVNVTTLPALYGAYPLFRLAGYRGALLVPMLGAVLTAFAARALAGRLTGGDRRAGWLAFWLVGLASPLAVYALDFWEHSLGVALVAWAVVFLLDIAGGRRSWRAATAAGLLLGTAATMRTEALIYAAVATVTCCALVALRQGGWRRAAAAGFAVVVGLALPLAANQALERATLQSDLRAGRAAATVTSAQTAGGDRVGEAILTAAGLEARLAPATYAGAALLVALLLILATGGARSGRGGRAAALAGAAAAGLYASRALSGLGFVPGMVAATPLAAVGLARGWRPFGGRGPGAGPAPPASSGPVMAVALLSLPLVWAFQYTGGAGPQWGGRYLLVSGFLLGVVGITRLGELQPWAQRLVVGLAVGVTCLGLAWLSVRSHDVARTMEALTDRPEPVLVSRLGHFVRDGGWFADQRRWLTAESRAEQADAVRVVEAAGFDRFGLVELASQPEPAPIPGWARTGSETLRYFEGVEVRVTSFARTG